MTDTIDLDESKDKPRRQGFAEEETAFGLDPEDDRPPGGPAVPAIARRGADGTDRTGQFPAPPGTRRD